MELMPYFELIIGFMVTIFLLELYIDIRQHKEFKKKKICKELEGHITDEVFDRSQKYNLDKSNFGFFSGIIEFIWNLAILYYGGLPFLWRASCDVLQFFGYTESECNTHEIKISCIFAILAGLISLLFSQPFSLYRTFVIEEKHGFNKTTAYIYVTDILKGFVLSIVIGLPLLSLMIFLIKWGGNFFWMYVWIALVIFSIFITFLYPTFILPWFNKIEPLEEGELREKVYKLAESVGFPLRKLFVMDGSKRSGHSNAFLFGFFKNKRIILFDTLVAQLSDNEVVSILAHELGHYKYSHVLKGFGISQINQLLFFYLFGMFVHDTHLYSEFGFHENHPVLIGLTLFSMVYEPFVHGVGFLMNILIRHFENQADAFAVNLGLFRDFSSALIKISADNLSIFSYDSWYSTYHNSHPSLVERLRNCQKVFDLQKKSE